MLLDLEIMILKVYPWSLYDLDRTDTTSIFDLIGRISSTGNKTPGSSKKAFIDQVDWL